MPKATKFLLIDSDDPGEHFERKLDAFLKTSSLEVGEIGQLSIWHDDWCLFLKNKGKCNCEPEFALQRPQMN